MNYRIVEKSIVHYTNKERQKGGRGKVFGNGQLIKAARGHGGWCARHDVMTHEGHDFSQPWDRATEAGYPSRTVSENMWQQHGRTTTTYGSKFQWRSDWEFGKAAVISWMNSPGHCTNLLKDTLNKVHHGLNCG